MTSSKLISNSNNNLVPTNSRIHSFVERLAPLDRASFEKTKARHRRPLPGPLEAAIDEVLAVRNDNSDGRLSERGESRDDSNNNDEPHPPIPKAKHTSSNKSQLQGRRPEWRRYIRRIMMTKGIQGSTLARYRRLVGIVARKSLNQTYDNAAERVVRYRLEFRSAAMIQTMILRGEWYLDAKNNDSQQNVFD
ncbi:hypothetical protein PHMEG_00026977 [Phytophthora megakarya]|uniref:Uncharacterized protein n=1 Tax=Phytophthora megakarya TaxID=4795 RepID=A0A225V9F2_9STRA|nr:hypothetical protein PHMEG_00026977 [Phytophthora megakarya]